MEAGLELVLGVGLAQRLDELLPSLGEGMVPLVPGGAQEVPAAALDELADGLDDLIREGDLLDLRLGPANALRHLLLEGDELSVDLLAEADPFQGHGLRD